MKTEVTVVVEHDHDAPVPLRNIVQDRIHNHHRNFEQVPVVLEFAQVFLRNCEMLLSAIRKAMLIKRIISSVQDDTHIC